MCHGCVQESASSVEHQAYETNAYETNTLYNIILVIRIPSLRNSEISILVCDLLVDSFAYSAVSLSFGLVKSCDHSITGTSIVFYILVWAQDLGCGP